MALHVAEDVILELLEQVVEVEVEVSGSSSGVVTGTSGPVVGSALVGIG